MSSIATIMFQIIVQLIEKKWSQMKYRMFCITAFVQVTISLSAQADTLSLGRSVAEAFFRGETDAIWREATPKMQEAIGSAGALAAWQYELSSTSGSEETVLSEQSEKRGQYEIYTRIFYLKEKTIPMELILTFDQNARIAGFFVRPQQIAAPSSRLDYKTKVQLRLPVKGSWYVYWGGREIEANYHAVDAAQRFALDLTIMQNGLSHVGNPTILENYHCWGSAILSPAKGIVASVVDGLPDQRLGSSDLENVAGNHVVIDFGNDEYGFIAHLQKGSVRVAKGDHVTTGQKIGECGNSGNTSEPHLHFHIQSSPRLGEGEGLPAQFVNYLANGNLISRGEPNRGESIQSAE